MRPAETKVTSQKRGDLEESGQLAQFNPRIRRGGLFGATLESVLAAIAELVFLARKAITNVPTFDSSAKLLNVIAAGASIGTI
jgi:hypothetical protein